MNNPITRTSQCIVMVAAIALVGGCSDDAKVHQAKRDADRQALRLAASERDNDDLRVKLRQAQDDLKTAQDRITEMQSQLGQLNEQLATAHTDAATTQRAAVEVEGAQAQVQKLQNEVTSLNEQIRRLSAAQTGAATTAPASH
jgi:chromosome segregation ATPase